MSLADIIIYGTHQQLHQAIQHGASINTLDEYGFTPLIESAIVNDPDKAQLLLDAKADVNLRDMTGGTALHWAVENSNTSFCELLLQHGADANAMNKAGQPILLNPILRQQNELKTLLYSHGAKLTVAQDYINTKLLGHRFELTGHIDIVNHKQRFIEVDLEGFFLEFTIGLITHSLVEYINHYSSREHRDSFEQIQYVIHAMQNASELIKYQQYQTDLSAYQNTIDELLNRPLKIIPVNFEGHAITIVALDQLLAICDRRSAHPTTDSIGIFQMNRQSALNTDLIKQLIYEKKTQQHITQQLTQILQLQVLCHYPISKQIAGNCSWANVEAALPVSLALLSIDFDELSSPIISSDHQSQQIFHDWREWDKDRALHFCIESFYEASPARKASKLALLAQILFQRCTLDHPIDKKRAEKIMRALQEPGYEYILQSYRQIYQLNQKTPHGRNLERIIRYFEDDMR